MAQHQIPLHPTPPHRISPKARARTQRYGSAGAVACRERKAGRRDARDAKGRLTGDEQSLVKQGGLLHQHCYNSRAIPSRDSPVPELYQNFTQPYPTPSLPSPLLQTHFLAQPCPARPCQRPWMKQRCSVAAKRQGHVSNSTGSRRGGWGVTSITQ